MNPRPGFLKLSACQTRPSPLFGASRTNAYTVAIPVVNQKTVLTNPLAAGVAKAEFQPHFTYSRRMGAEQVFFQRFGLSANPAAGGICFACPVVLRLPFYSYVRRP